MRSARAVLLILTLSLTAACSGPGSSDDLDAGEPDAEVFNFPPPRTDLVPAVGTASAIDIATWNVENFPYIASSVPLMADLIASLDLDLVAIQEVEDIAAFDELVARLRGYSGVLSTHAYGNGAYQKIGYVYRSELLRLEAPFLLFDRDGYEWPRPAMQVAVTVLDSSGADTATDFLAIGLHLKAGQGPEDRDRRIAAMGMLETHIRSNVDGSGDDDIIVLGDFNQTLAESDEVFAPFTAAPERYSIQTEALAAAGVISHLGTRRLIDHVLTTASLDDELAGRTTIIPPLDEQLSNYFADVSDHLPVVISIPIPQ